MSSQLLPKFYHFWPSFPSESSCCRQMQTGASVAFDIYGRGPYTGLSDGRIVRYQGSTDGFADFAFTKPNRSKGLCDGTTDPANGPICGRPLGIRFFYRTGELYIADAYRGLVVVGTNGKLATQLATSADGVPFRLLRDLDIDQSNGKAYFTDPSAVYTQPISHSKTKRWCNRKASEYDLASKQVRMLLNGLSIPAGVAVSSDSSFLLVGESGGHRITKYWLEGPKANPTEIIVQFPDLGRPQNIVGTVLNDFWVAVNLNNGTVPTAILINKYGTELRRITLSEYYNSTRITEFVDRVGRGYIGSIFTNFIGVIDSLLI